MLRPFDRVKLDETRYHGLVEVGSFYRVRVRVAFEQLQTHAVLASYTPDKELSYRSETARRSMLVSLCYMFHEVWQLQRF